jgi:hypothetical protein
LRKQIVDTQIAGIDMQPQPQRSGDLLSQNACAVAEVVNQLL